MPCDSPPGLLDCLFLGKGMLVKLLFYVETGLFTISWKIIMLIISTLENGTQMLVCLFCSILFLVSISKWNYRLVVKLITWTKCWHSEVLVPLNASCTHNLKTDFISPLNFIRCTLHFSDSMTKSTELCFIFHIYFALKF